MCSRPTPYACPQHAPHPYCDAEGQPGDHVVLRGDSVELQRGQAVGEDQHHGTQRVLRQRREGF
jgi:hypothetical protein